jgi:hypothetical protein
LQRTKITQEKNPIIRSFKCCDTLAQDRKLCAAEYPVGCTLFRNMYYIQNEHRGNRGKLERRFMKILSAAVSALLITAAAASPPAQAATALFATEPAATQACAVDEVVWVDLDRGKYYHKAQANFAKGSNGGYACLKAAHSQYRESHD